MNDAELRLANPPIIEAVLDIDCDLPPERDFAEVEKNARDTFRAEYPKLRKLSLQQFQVSTKEDAPPEPKVHPQRIMAFQFLTAAEDQLVQVRQQGYSFNRLTPYKTLDDYLPEIRRTWEAYRTVVGPLQIRAVRLRYINRILLPMVDGKCKLDDYLSSSPQVPDEDHLAVTGFITQCAAVDTATGHQVNIVLTAQKPEADRLPVILDLCAAAAGPADPADWAWLSQRIASIRELCKRIFEKSVTLQCLNLFQ